MKRLEIAASFQITDEEYRKALTDMRDWGRRRAIDKCLAEYEVDVILGPRNSRINEFSSAAGTSLFTPCLDDIADTKPRVSEDCSPPWLYGFQWSTIWRCGGRFGEPGSSLDSTHECMGTGLQQRAQASDLDVGRS